MQLVCSVSLPRDLVSIALWPGASSRLPRAIDFLPMALGCLPDEIVIRGGLLPKPVIAENVKVVDGFAFIYLAKSNPVLCKFICWGVLLDCVVCVSGRAGVCCWVVLGCAALPFCDGVCCLAVLECVAGLCVGICCRDIA
jgi:hypothetical protein